MREKGEVVSDRRLKEEKRKNAQRDRLARCRAATREFRKQFAEYFKTQVEELEPSDDDDDETEVQVDSTAEAQTDQQADMSTSGQPEAIADMESEQAEEEEEDDSEEEQEEEEEEEQEEEEQLEEEEEEEEEYSEFEGDTLYIPLIPYASSTHSRPAFRKTSSISSKPESKCSRFKRLFRNLVIINDKTYSACVRGCDVKGEATTYRVMTPPRLVRAAAREITRASGLPAPVVNIITDYCKHELEGTRISAKRVKSRDFQWFVIRHNGGFVLSTCREKNEWGLQVWDGFYDEHVDRFIELFSKLGVPLRQGDVAPLLRTLFSPHPSRATAMFHKCPIIETVYPRNYL